MFSYQCLNCILKFSFFFPLHPFNCILFFIASGTLKAELFTIQNQSGIFIKFFKVSLDFKFCPTINRCVNKTGNFNKRHGFTIMIMTQNIKCFLPHKLNNIKGSKYKAWIQPFGTSYREFWGSVICQPCWSSKPKVPKSLDLSRYVR